MNVFRVHSDLFLFQGCINLLVHFKILILPDLLYHLKGHIEGATSSPSGNQGFTPVSDTCNKMGNLIP